MASEEQSLDQALKDAAAASTLSMDSDATYSDPYMPDCPYLKKFLGLSSDLFLITPTNLVRKAMDELTLGVHFYILFSLTHSKSIAIIKHNEKAAIRFEVTSGYEWKMGKFDVINRDNPIKFTFDMNSKEKFIASLKKYIDSSISKDFRHLLKHIRNVNKSHIRTDYYSQEIVDIFEKMRMCAIFFYHRNGLVPLDPKSKEPFNREAVFKRERNMATYFFALDLEEAKFPQHQFNNQLKWINNVCCRIREAAFIHFRSFNQIKEFYNIMSKACSVTSPTFAYENCFNYLGSNLHNPDVRQFVVFTLWTRFGHYIKKSETKENSKDMCYVNAVKLPTIRFPFHYAKLNRPTIIQDPDKLEVDFIDRNYAQILFDPFGITHLDMMNRALDVANEALRKILSDSLSEEAKVPKGGTIRNDLYISLLNIPENEGFDPMEGIQIPDLADVAIFKRVYKNTNAKLIKIFCDRHFPGVKMGVSESVRKFISFDPTFADPRFIGEFLQRQNKFDLASDLIKIRDHASHQLTLQRGSYLKFNELNDGICKLRLFVENVAKGLEPINFKKYLELDEVKALDELKALLTQYQRWRSRQYYLTKNCQKSPEFWKTIANETLNYIKNRQMDRCSQEALRYLLNFCQPQKKHPLETFELYQPLDNPHSD